MVTQFCESLYILDINSYHIIAKIIAIKESFCFLLGISWFQDSSLGISFRSFSHLELIFVYSLNQLLLVEIQNSQHHLLSRHSFPQRIFLVPCWKLLHCVWNYIWPLIQCCTRSVYVDAVSQCINYCQVYNTTQAWEVGVLQLGFSCSEFLWLLHVYGYILVR